MTNYITESYQVNLIDRIITITNLTPKLSAKEKQDVKTRIEQKLYEVFCKYVPSNICQK